MSLTVGLSVDELPEQARALAVREGVRVVVIQDGQLRRAELMHGLRLDVGDLLVEIPKPAESVTVPLVLESIVTEQELRAAMDEHMRRMVCLPPDPIPTWNRGKKTAQWKRETRRGRR